MGFFSIPGNIKQQFIPFVLNPKAAINCFINCSRDLKHANEQLAKGVPQIFTYKYRKNNNLAGGRAKLRFYPSSMDNIKFNDDISLKLLYSNMNNQHTKTSVTMKDILNAIPGIQIREYIPDTRLDQCMNFIMDFFDAIGNMLKPKDDKVPNEENTTTNNKNNKQTEKTSFNLLEFGTRIRNVAQWIMEYMTGMCEKNFYYDMNTIPGIDFSSYKKDIYTNVSWGNNGKSQGYYVMTFPYMMYYTLQSCVTTNIYEVPAIDSAKRILDNADNGSAGWGAAGDDMLASGSFTIQKLLGGDSGGGIIKTIMNTLFGNIGINYTPWWDADSGVVTKEPAIELKFDLFNDSFDAALANFIFVNTIIPNNRWIQYNMFQHSSSIYDVKIEGLNRLYACSGSFSVTYGGVLRNPPMAFINTLVQKHANQNMSQQFKDNIVRNKLIKIPDVYHVTLRFNSLLPQNFNNYIYIYAENKDHALKYADHAYDASGMAERLGSTLGKFAKRAAAAWKKGDKSVTDAIDAANAAVKDTAQQKAQNTGENVSNVSYDNDQGDIQD